MKLKNSPYTEIFIIISLILLFIIITQFAKIEGHAGLIKDWIESFGTHGMIVFVVLCVLAFVLALPASFLIVMAGALYGSLHGVIIVSIGATIGAALCFLISRYFARDLMLKWIGSKQSFRKLDQLIEDNGAIVVAMTRLVLVFPYAVLNYGFGLTKVSFWTYLFLSWLCMLPEITLLVVGMDTILRFIRGDHVSWSMIAIVLVILGVVIALGKVAHKKLKI